MSTETQNLWKRTDCVCFDVDSTVITIESLDELATFCGYDVSTLTNKSMSGEMTFQDCLNMQLEIIKPTIKQIKEFIRNKPAPLSPGIQQLTKTLQDRNIPVYLVSGGFVEIIAPVAKKLRIPYDNIYANRFKFYFDGEYAGFDGTMPTSRTGGKGIVVNDLKTTYGHKALVIIGDGINDLEACPPADAFIGYGGNVIRETVRSQCKWYVTDFAELIEVFNE